MDKPSPVFPYGERETEWLKKADPALGAVIDRLGRIERAIEPDLFSALVKAIVGQQISTRAQATIWARIRERFSPLTPGRVDALPAEELQSCGISMRKALYIKGIAREICRGALDLDALHSLPDKEVCERLCALGGVGVWTAEMLMIFSMRRTNILSYGDLAIQRGLRMLYRHRRITPALYRKYLRRYTPCASVASFYLWAVAGGACPELTDPGQKKASAKKAGRVQSK